jgi:hypothetical protein
MDRVEKIISYVAVGFTALLAIFYIPRLLHDTTLYDSTNPVHHQCVKPFLLVGALCEHTYTSHPSTWWPQFILLVLLALVAWYFSFRKKRVGVIFTSALIGLSLGLKAGYPFLFLSGWLVLRAYRLQKYGSATFAGTSKIARERAASKRAARAGTAKDAAPAPPVRKTPNASKRYTPRETRGRK